MTICLTMTMRLFKLENLMTTLDPFNLNRFLGAQESYYADARKEIKQGYKPNNAQHHLRRSLRRFL